MLLIASMLAVFSDWFWIRWKMFEFRSSHSLIHIKPLRLTKLSTIFWVFKKSTMKVLWTAEDTAPQTCGCSTDNSIWGFCQLGSWVHQTHVLKVTAGIFFYFRRYCSLDSLSFARNCVNSLTAAEIKQERFL